MAIIEYYIGSHGPYFVDDTSDQYLNLGQLTTREEVQSGDSTLSNKTLESADANEIYFNPALTATTNMEGCIRWNWAAHSLEYLKSPSLAIPAGQANWGLAINDTGGSVVAGKVVYLSSIDTSTGLPKFKYADASNATKISHVGVTMEAMNNLASGAISVFGTVSSINTSAWAQYDKLYIAADSSGTLTKVIPALPHYRVWVATVQVVSSTVGKILVNPQLDLAADTAVPGLAAVSGDVQIFTATKGVVLKDRSTGVFYRLRVTAGVLGIESI